MNDATAQTNDHRPDARRQRLEAMARILAAEKEGNLDDELGHNLPGFMWRGFIPKAEAIFTIIGGFRG